MTIHQHLAHSCCGCSWTVSSPPISPQGSATLILYLLSKWGCLGVYSTQMVSILVFQTSFPLSFCLDHCSFGTSSRRRSCLCQTLVHQPPCTSFYSEVQVARDWGQFTYGPVLAGDEYMLCLLCSPKGALDTSLICLPHPTVHPLVQTSGQLPGLEQRLFVKESKSHVCPCPVKSPAFPSSENSGTATTLPSPLQTTQRVLLHFL